MTTKTNAGQRANRNAAFEAFEREIFRLDDAAAFAGCSKSTLYQAMKMGLLPARKNGRVTILFRRDILAWLSALPLKTVRSAVHAQRARERWAAEKQEA